MVVVWWLGCAAPVAEAPDPVPVAAPAPAPAPPRAGKAKRGKRASGGKNADPQPKIPAKGVPVPLHGLSDADLCSSDTLLMLKYGFEDLQNGRCRTVCCGADAEHWCCEMDWPFSDWPPCEAYSEMRNGLFARHGYPFTDPKWQTVFNATSYYTRRDDFQDSWLSPVVKANVADLKRREDEKVGCGL